MAMVIQGIDGAKHDFPSAVSWHIDDDGYLHVAEAASLVNRRERDGSAASKTRPLASFAPGHWAAVQIVRASAGPFASNE